MASTPSTEDQDNEYFLSLVNNHPNLYNVNHEFFNDSTMEKQSLGQIALCMCINREEAELKWKTLLDNYKEEDSLRSAETLQDVRIDADLGGFRQYQTMKKMFDACSQTANPSSICKKKLTGRKTKKAQVAKYTKKAKENCDNLKRAIAKTLDYHRTEPNQTIGRIVLSELQRSNLQISAKKRNELFAFLNNTEALLGSATTHSSGVPR